MLESKPFIGEHPHRCQYCKSGWLCQGKKCTVKVTTCWPCSIPANVRSREAKRIAARDKERNAGVTPNIFDNMLGEPEYDVIYTSSSKSVQVVAYADYLSLGNEALNEVMNKAYDKAALSLMAEMTKPWGVKILNAQDSIT